MKSTLLIIFATTVVMSLCAELAAESERDLLWKAQGRAQDSGVYNLHHVKMRRERVSICWQKQMTSDVNVLTMLHEFPNGEEFEDGGELMVPRLARVKRWRYICPQCNRTAKEWAAAHRDDPEAQCILSHSQT